MQSVNLIIHISSFDVRQFFCRFFNAMIRTDITALDFWAQYLLMIYLFAFFAVVCIFVRLNLFCVKSFVSLCFMLMKTCVLL